MAAALAAAFIEGETMSDKFIDSIAVLLIRLTALGLVTWIVIFAYLSM